MKQIKDSLKQLFFRKGKFFPPYFFATIFLTGISVLFILVIVDQVWSFILDRTITFSMLDLAGLLGTTATWMGFYKFTDDKKEKENGNSNKIENR